MALAPAMYSGLSGPRTFETVMFSVGISTRLTIRLPTADGRVSRRFLSISGPSSSACSLPACASWCAAFSRASGSAMSERTLTAAALTAFPPADPSLCRAIGIRQASERSGNSFLLSRYLRTAPPATARKMSLSVAPRTLARTRLIRERGIPKPSTTRWADTA